MMEMGRPGSGGPISTVPQQAEAAMRRNQMQVFEWFNIIAEKILSYNYSENYQQWPE